MGITQKKTHFIISVFVLKTLIILFQVYPQPHPHPTANALKTHFQSSELFILNRQFKIVDSKAEQIMLHELLTNTAQFGNLR